MTAPNETDRSNRTWNQTGKIKRWPETDTEDWMLGGSMARGGLETGEEEETVLFVYLNIIGSLYEF